MFSSPISSYLCVGEGEREREDGGRDNWRKGGREEGGREDEREKESVDLQILALDFGSRVDLIHQGGAVLHKVQCHQRLFEGIICKCRQHNK